MRLPELYLIGAPKAGTTAVARWLGAHRQVYWSVPKEPFYWATDYPRMRAHYGFDTLQAYSALYASRTATSADVRGDGSTIYLYSQTAVPDIMRAVVRPRFVVCLRNPVDLLISYHRTQLVALNESEPDFGRAWRRSMRGDLPNSDPLDPKLLDYPLVGRLGAAVNRLAATVPPNQVHYILFDELTATPDRVWRALAAFVDIDPVPVPDFTVENASNNVYRSPQLRRLAHRPPRLVEPAVRRLRQWSRTTGSQRVLAIKQRMWRETERPRAKPADRQAVADFLQDDVALLSRCLDHDLSGWRS